MLHTAKESTASQIIFTHVFRSGALAGSGSWCKPAHVPKQNPRWTKEGGRQGHDVGVPSAGLIRSVLGCRTSGYTRERSVECCDGLHARVMKHGTDLELVHFLAFCVMLLMPMSGESISGNPRSQKQSICLCVSCPEIMRCMS